VWSRDGKELFYWNESAGLVTIMAVPILPGSSFAWGPSYAVVKGRFEKPSDDTQFDVWDRRFLVVKTAEGADRVRSEITIVTNWFDELNRLMPSN